MFSLFSACVGCTRDATAGRKKVTLVILGLDNSGKSTVSACLQNNSTEDVTPTLGFANGRARLRGCDVTLLDLGGSERIRDIWNNYYAESHGVIFVVDASDRERLVESKEILINVIRDSRIAGKPLLIYANKQDHKGAMTDMELFRFLDLEQVSQGSIDQCRVVSCSALRSCQRGSKVDGRIKRGIRWLLSCVKGNWEYLSEKVTREYSAQREAEERERRERKERVRRLREERERKAAEEGTTEQAAENVEVTPGDPFKPITTVIADVEVRKVESIPREPSTTHKQYSIAVESEPEKSEGSSNPSVESERLPAKPDTQKDGPDSPPDGPPDNPDSPRNSPPDEPDSPLNEPDSPLNEPDSPQDRPDSPQDRPDSPPNEPTSPPDEPDIPPDRSDSAEDKPDSPPDNSDSTTATIVSTLKSKSASSLKNEGSIPLNTSTAHSSGSSLSSVRLEPLNVDLIKKSSNKKKPGAWSRRNKVAPISGDKVSTSDLTEEKRSHSTGMIKLKSSKENLLEGNPSAENITSGDTTGGDTRDTTGGVNPVSEDNILSQLGPPKSEVDKIPAISVQSPGLGDTHFLL